MALFTCAKCGSQLSRHMTACPECGARVATASVESAGGTDAFAAGSAARRSWLRWLPWIAGGAVLLWVAADFLMPESGRPGVAGTSGTLVGSLPGAAPAGTVTAPDSVAPRWGTAQPPAAAPVGAGNGQVAVTVADPKVVAVQQELLRISALANLDVGTADAPAAGWLASGTPQQQANRARLARVLARCSREVGTDGTDPQLLPALHSCMDRMVALGVP